MLLKAATSFLPGAFVARTRGCTWFICAPSNNYTISPTDKWISRREVRTVGTCTEGVEAVPLQSVLIPGGRPPPRLIHYLSTKLFRPSVAHNNYYQKIKRTKTLKDVYITRNIEQYRSQYIYRQRNIKKLHIIIYHQLKRSSIK